MSSPISNRDSPPEQPSHRKDGRNPPPDSPPEEGFQDLVNGLRESTKYGVYLFFLNNSFDWPLAQGQVLWIVHCARKLSDAELLRAAKFSLELTNSEQARRRLDSKIRHLYYRVRSLDPKTVPEKRTIGIGYRDKGSLRPLHEKGRSEGELSFWDEEIKYILPLVHKIEGKWITADEVISLTGVEPLILALLQVQAQTSVIYAPDLYEKILNQEG